MATATIHLSAKIEPELKKQIEEMAKNEERSMSQMVRCLLKQGVNTFKSKQGVNTRNRK